MFHDIGHDALSLAEIDSLCRIAIAKTRNLLIQCRFGVLGESRQLVGRSPGLRRRQAAVLQ